MGFAAAVVGAIQGDVAFARGQSLLDAGIIRAVGVVVLRDYVAPCIVDREEPINPRTAPRGAYFDDDALRLREFDGEDVDIAIALNHAVDHLRSDDQERREAEGLVDLSKFLMLLRLRAQARG